MSPVIGCWRGAGHPEGIPDFAYAWLEAPLAARLAWKKDVPEWRDPETWPAGRVFGPEGEYRWQRLDGETLHGVLLLDTDSLPATFGSLLPLTPGEDASLVLWGEWVNPDGDPEGNPDGGPRFYAQEIPEIQDYPIEAGLKEGVVPRLQVRRYRDVEGKHGEFVRCVGVSLSPAEASDHG
jgi:hypothetical protein